MANNIKRVGSGLGLQITKAARGAGLVLENLDGEATRLATVYVYVFDNTVVVIDADQVSSRKRAEIVASAARDTKSIYGGERVDIQIKGNGYALSLPGVRDGGFEDGDQAPVVTGEGVIVIHKDNPRLAEDLTTW